MGRIFPLLSQYMCNFDREQTGRHLHRLFAISRQHLCVWWVLLIHSTFCRDLARLWLFSSGSNLEQECPVGTVIICILTPGWVCYVRSPRPKIISTAISMKFEEFLLCFFFLFCFGVFFALGFMVLAWSKWCIKVWIHAVFYQSKSFSGVFYIFCKVYSFQVCNLFQQQLNYFPCKHVIIMKND